MQPQVPITPPTAPPATPPADNGFAAAFAANTSMTLGQKTQTDVQALAPLASTYTTQTNMGSVAPMPTTSASKGNAIQQLGAWATGFANGTGDLIAGAAKSLFNSTIDAIEAPIKFGMAIGNEINLSTTIDTNSKQAAAFSDQMNALSSSYRSGRISQQQYKDQMKSISANIDELSKSVDQTVAQVTQNATDTGKQALLVAGDVVSILTLGAGAGLTAVVADSAKTVLDGSVAPVINFFGQREIAPTLLAAASKIDAITSNVINGINKVTTFNGQFSHGAIADIVHTTIGEAAPTLTAAQIAKSAAINILIKRPLIYQTNIDLAAGIYQDIAKGDLSGATLSTVLTASMALGAGPLGYALDALKGTDDWLKAAMFVGGKISDLNAATNITSGIASKTIGDFVTKEAQTSVSRQSFIDAVSATFGKGNKSQLYDYILSEAQKGNMLPLQSMKVMEEVNMKLAGGNAVTAAGLIKDHYAMSGRSVWLSNATPEQLVTDMAQHVKARDIAVQDAIASGLSRAEAERIVVGRANYSDLAQIGEILKTADKVVTPAYGADFTNIKGIANGKVVSDMSHNQYISNLQTARHTIFNQMIEKYGRTTAWANNDNFIAKVRSLIDSNVPTDTLIKDITNIKVGSTYEGISAGAKKELQKLGYLAVLPKKTFTPYVKFEETNGLLKTQFAKDNPGFAKVASTQNISKGSTSIFEQAVTPKPIMQFIGTALTKIGLSPESTQQAVQTFFKDNFAKSMAIKGVDATGVDSQTILDQLNNFMNAPTRMSAHAFPVADLRQLTGKDIASATGITDKNVIGQIKHSISNSFLQIPLAVRGLGDKILDVNYSINPLAAGYARVQGAGRFVWNPFFKLQQGAQTEMFAQLESGGKIIQLPGLNWVNKVIFPSMAIKTADTVQLLESNGMFGKGLESQISGLAAHGQIGTRVTIEEKNSLAGLVVQRAAKEGYQNVSQYVQDNHSAVLDMLRTITVSNSHSTGVLDSPLVRTINAAFFPFRYNMKVAGLMADYVGKMQPATQVAMIASLYNFHNFITSNQGIAWQQQHSQAISLFNWLSPTYPLSYVMQVAGVISHPGDSSIGDLGLLGGLPFGFIPQLLEGEGLISYSAPYVDPTSGKVFPKYIPNSTTGDVAVAIQDLLGSLFSYPGARIGLPSKGSLLRGLTNGLIGGKNDYTQVDQTGNLTPEQQNQSQVLQQNAPGGNNVTPTSTLTPPNNTVTNVPVTPPKVAPKYRKPASIKKSSVRPTPLT